MFDQLVVDDAEIEFSDRGAGDPVVLAHAGVFADWFARVAASPSLRGLRVIRLRRAGYVAGSPPARHLTLGDHARHVGLLDALGISAAHVCGHSSSALIGLQLAMAEPAAVAGSVLLDPASGIVLQAPSQQAFTATVARPALAAAAAGQAAAAFDIWMTGIDTNYRAVLETSLGAEGSQHAADESRFFFADELPAVREWTLDRDRAVHIGQPVLLVNGAGSRRNFHDMVDLLAGVLPNAKVATLPGVGHLMPLEDPDAVGRLIADFARQHPVARRQQPIG